MAVRAPDCCMAAGTARIAPSRTAATTPTAAGPLAAVRETAEALRQEHLDTLAEEFLALVAEYLLGLGVDHRDIARPVDHDHRAGRGFHDLAEALHAMMHHTPPLEV